jgi:DNA polymerase III subunit epsilon
MMVTGLVRGRFASRGGRLGAAGRLLAVDLETTGLEADAEIIAIGDVPIVDGAIRLGEATHQLVRPGLRSAALGIEAHHLRPVDVATAPPIEAVLPDLLERIDAADAMVVHHAALDLRVLRQACRATGRRWPDPPVIDTVGMIEQVRRWQRNLGGPRMPRDLVGARATLGLPPHDEHDARADAVATAELYLALRARLRS